MRWSSGQSPSAIFPECTCAPPAGRTPRQPGTTPSLTAVYRPEAGRRPGWELREIEHDLAGRAAAVDELERLDALLERVARADERPDVARRDELVDRRADLAVDLRLGHHVGAPARP